MVFVNSPRQKSKFGLGANYSKFDSDGTLRMYGEATVFKDQLQSLLVQLKNNPADKLVINTAEASVEYKSDATLLDYSVMNIQINHDWKIGSILYPHLHWYQAQDQTPNWLLQYRWQQNGGLKDTVWKNFPLLTNTFDLPGTGETIIQITYNSVGITPPITSGLSDILQLRLIRDTQNTSTLFTRLDTYVGNAGTINLDVHLEINSIGSKEEYVK